jgi:xanthine dehydrogenase YagR molybdenum-binding subunit
MHDFAYLRPRSTSEAVQLLVQHQPGARYFAGGTTLFDLMKLGVEAPATVIDITRIEGLARIDASDRTELRIGALAAMSDVAEHAVVQREFPALSESLWKAASQQLRNMATVGGNLLQRTRCAYFRGSPEFACNKRAPGSGCSAIGGQNRGHAVLGGSDACVAIYPGDMAIALTAFDAVVDTVSPRGERTVAVRELHREPGATPHLETVLAADELIVRIRIPRGPGRPRLDVPQDPRPRVVCLRARLGGRGGAHPRQPRGRCAHRARRRRDPAVAGDRGRAQPRRHAAHAGRRTARGRDGFCGREAARTQRVQGGARHRDGDRCAHAGQGQELKMANPTITTKNKNTPRAGAERVDAHDKVRGATRYAADDARPGLLHAALVPSRIARGTVTRIDTSAAQRVRGVRTVLTHENVGAFDTGGFLMGGGFGFQSFYPLRSAQIAYRGQSVAMVVADTLEAAREAASLVAVTYEATPFVATLDAPDAEPLAQTAVLPQPMFADRRVGNPEGALAGAAVTVDLRYTLPAQHQNPMEIIATVAEWNDGVLTIREPTQNAEGVRHGLAKQLGIEPAKVRVLSPTLGGGFGQKNSLQSHTVLVAIAARTLQRPVKLVMTRAQLFHNASFRPASRHRVRLGADRDGRLVAAVHEIDQQTSRHDLFPSFGTEITSRLYGIGNYQGRERLVRTDVQTPGYMRAPFEHPAAFAFESAIDEMAYALDRDPVAFRLANDATADPLTGKPFSSRHVAECLVKGSETFGWARRTMAPGSMRAPDGSLVGWGVAIGTYKAAMAPAIATVRLNTNGTVRVAVGGHEMGQGMRTAIAVTVARALGAPVAAVEILLGDTRAAPQHLTAGSWGTATALPPVLEAAQRLMDDLRKNAGSTAGESGVTALALLRASGRPFRRSRKPPSRPRTARPGVRPPDRWLAGRRGAGVPRLRRLQLHRAFRRSAHRADHAPHPRAARGQRGGLRRGRQPAHGAQPGRRRRGLGYRCRAARGERGRCALRRVPQCRPGGIRDASGGGHRPHRGRLCRQTRHAAQRNGREGAWRSRDGGRGAGHRERGVPRDRQAAAPAAADAGRPAGDLSLTGCRTC